MSLDLKEFLQIADARLTQERAVEMLRGADENDTELVYQILDLAIANGKRDRIPGIFESLVLEEKYIPARIIMYSGKMEPLERDRLLGIPVPPRAEEQRAFRLEFEIWNNRARRKLKETWKNQRYSPTSVGRPGSSVGS